MTIALKLANAQSKSVLPIAVQCSTSEPLPFWIEEPPTANRGLIPQTPTKDLIPTIDNCCFSLKSVAWETVLEMRLEIETLGKTSFVDKPEQGRKHGTYFPSHMSCPLGSMILYRERIGFGDLYDICVVVPGKICQRMGTSAVAGMVRLVRSYQGTFSRIDINVDDYIRDLTDEAITAAASQGHYTRFQTWEPRRVIKCTGEVLGFTHYFGSRQGETFVRIYDALPVHGIDATRFEVEYKGDNANAIAKMIDECESDEMLSETLGGILNGTFRITTDKRNHNTNRIPSATFWQRFSDRLASARKLVTERVVPSLGKKLGWIRQQCSKSLAMFQQYYGVDWRAELDAVIKEGLSRFKAIDFALFEAGKKDGFVRFWDSDNHIIDVMGKPDWWRDWMEDGNLPPEPMPF